VRVVPSQACVRWCNQGFPYSSDLLAVIAPKSPNPDSTESH
jgi:hypothetical protein